MRQVCLRVGLVLCAVAMAASCGSGGHNKTPDSAGFPANYVALDFPAQGTDVQLQLFSTATGAIVRNLNLSGLPSDVYLSDLSSVAVGGNSAYWAAIQAGPTFQGHVVVTPFDGAQSKVLTTGVDAVPSPDGTRLFIVETARESGSIPSGFTLYDLSSGRTTDLPALTPLRGYVTFAWLPDDHTVVALYPGYSGCSGPTACFPVPIAPAPAAWTLDTSVPSQGWRAVRNVGEATAGMRLLGPGPTPGSLAAELQTGSAKLALLDANSGLSPSGGRVNIQGYCDGVDHSGLNFICNSAKGIVGLSSGHQRPEVIGPAGLYNYALAWS